MLTTLSDSAALASTRAIARRWSSAVRMGLGLQRGQPASALEAFILEHENCGELDSAVEEDRVWMTCSRGAVLVRLSAFG